MGKWFNQAAEIDRLRDQVKRQAATIEQLRAQLSAAGVTPAADAYGVSEEERSLVAQGRRIEAIKVYRERTGCDLVTAKKAIDSVL